MMQLTFMEPTYPAAEQWRAANPEAYRQIIEWAEWDQLHGTRPAIDLYVNLLRRPHFARMLKVQALDAVVLVNNNVRSELARLIVSENPHLRFELRDAKADKPQAVNATPIARSCGTCSRPIFVCGMAGSSAKACAEWTA